MNSKINLSRVVQHGVTLPPRVVLAVRVGQVWRGVVALAAVSAGPRPRAVVRAGLDAVVRVSVFAARVGRLHGKPEGCIFERRYTALPTNKIIPFAQLALYHSQPPAFSVSLRCKPQQASWQWRKAPNRIQFIPRERVLPPKSKRQKLTYEWTVNQTTFSTEFWPVLKMKQG